MITVENITLHTGISDPYGYFCLGVIDLNGFLALSNIRCDVCISESQKFKVHLYKIGGGLSTFLVLSDFSKIPDIAVINNEEILSSIKELLENYFLDNESVFCL